MKYKWLNKSNNDKLVIFFSGWGMDDYIVSGLDCGEYDVVTLFDYNDMSLDIDLSGYSEKHVIGWSMGVLISTLFDFDNVKTRTALCATPYTVDDNYGIPKRIYNLTVKGFSEDSLQKFMERMFRKGTTLKKYSNRTFESQKSELEKMAEYKAGKNCRFSKAVIPEYDLIIPTKNQMKYWNENKDNGLNDKPIVLKTIPTGHCPFSVFKSWSDIFVDL